MTPSVSRGRNRAHGKALLLALAIATPCAAEWKVETVRSKMDDSSNVHLLLKSDDAVRVWPNKTIRPLLFLQCIERKLSVWFETGASFNVEYGNLQKATIRFRFDDRPAFAQVWHQSTDNKAAGTFGTDFAKKIGGAKKLTVEWTSFNSSPQTVQFDLTGFNQAKAPLEAACRVKL